MGVRIFTLSRKHEYTHLLVHSFLRFPLRNLCYVLPQGQEGERDKDSDPEDLAVCEEVNKSAEGRHTGRCALEDVIAAHPGPVAAGVGC